MVDRFMNGGWVIDWSRCVNRCMSNVSNSMSGDVCMANSPNCCENDEGLQNNFENYDNLDNSTF